MLAAALTDRLQVWRVALLAVPLWLGACSTTVTSPTPPGLPAPVASRLSLEQANDVTVYAISLVGTPYRYGGNTPESGFDCSGLIGHVYQMRAQVAAPRTVALLRDWGQAVSGNAARSGDLVLFMQKGTATHAGIYVGQGRFVHAPSSGGVVRLDSLTTGYWVKQPMLFVRP